MLSTVRGIALLPEAPGNERRGGRHSVTLAGTRMESGGAGGAAQPPQRRGGEGGEQRATVSLRDDRGAERSHTWHRKSGEGRAGTGAGGAMERRSEERPSARRLEGKWQYRSRTRERSAGSERQSSARRARAEPS